MFHRFKFWIVFFYLVNLLIPANALLLCKIASWSYSYDAYSPSSGWGNVYSFGVPTFSVPYCATYRITITQFAGDNDDAWWHEKSATYTATLAAGTYITVIGQVAQVEANQCVTMTPGYPCPWYVNTQLIVGSNQVASLNDSGVNNTNAKDTDIDRGRVIITVTIP